MAPTLDFLWAVAISCCDRGATITNGIVQAHPYVHYLLPLPFKLMSYFTSLLTSAEGVLAQAIHIPADVSLLRVARW